MARAEIAFNCERDSQLMAAIIERKEAACSGTGRGDDHLHAELFYRIFCGEDKGLQDLAFRCLLEEHN